MHPFARIAAARRFGLLLAVVLAAALWPQGQAAAQSGYYYLTGLDPQGDNFLALRSEPSGRGYRIAKLGPQTLLDPTGARVGRWLEVEVVNTAHAGLYGWVFDRYVACCSGSSQQMQPTNWGRVAHPRGAALNVRQGPSLNTPVVTSIPNGTSLPYSDCIYESEVRSWCQVSYAGRNGWVSTRYFRRW